MTLKQKILRELASCRGQSLSGQELAARFGVSRNAVWKAVKSLESEGYRVSGLTNRGYALDENALTPFDLCLPSEISTHFFKSIDSTNNEAKRMLAAGFSGSAFLFADEQTAGRGRQGKSFYSPKGTGLYYSYIFHPDKTLADAVFITTAAAVSVVRAIEKTTALKPEIKWVNDVYIGNKKICGILSEAITDFESGSLESVIIGIGVNVSTEQFPEELRESAGSLNAAQVSRAKLLQALARELICVCENPESPDILEDYRRRSLVLGREVTFLRNGKLHKGTATAIDEKGALLVQTPQGTERLDSGEITLRTIPT